jgi:hypothetical protein
MNLIVVHLRFIKLKSEKIKDNLMFENKELMRKLNLKLI